jgi:PAS domain S-box-containing protein
VTERFGRWHIPRDPDGYRPYLNSLLIGFFCLTITVLSFVILHNRENAKRDRDFYQQALVYASALQGQIDRDLEIVHSIVSFYGASTLVTRAEFQMFVGTTLKRHPEVQALEWIPRVRLWERPRYEDPARYPDQKPFVITELDAEGDLVRAGQREEYYPVYFLEPLAGNERARGFDLGSEPNRRAALERARDTGLPVATHPTRLVQEGSDRAGMVVLYPVYKNDRIQETVEERREDHKGFAAGVFRIADLIEFMVPAEPSLAHDFRLLDVTASDSALVLCMVENGRMVPEGEASEPSARARWSGPDVSVPVSIPSRSWRLQFRTRNENFSQEYLQPAWGILVFGSLLTILLTAYLVNRTRHALGMEALEVDLSKTSAELEHGLRERRLTARALRKSEALFGAVFEHGQYAIAVADSAGRLVNCNRAFERLLGYPAAELVGTHFRNLTFADDQSESLRLFGKLASGEIRQFEMEKRYVRKDGEIIWCRTGVSALYNQSGEFEAAIPMLVDITSRKIAEQDREDLQQQLLHTQKMEAVGRLAGGIAHDFNNLLTVMRGYTSLSLEEIPSVDPVYGYLEEMEKATERAESLTRQLLAFGRKQFLQPRVLNVNDIIADMGKMLGRLIGEDVELETRLADDIRMVKADIGQMEQVIMNLAVNARDAMPQGGRLIIETRNVTLVHPRKGSDPDIPPGDYATLIMRDTGEGMDKEILDKIFEPFFTTKAVGAGTGLGLATVYGVMTQSGGHVTVESELGAGSVFTVYLPATDEPADARAAGATNRPGPAGTETILLVEDEPMVRQVARDALLSFGYQVLDAADGAEALGICQAHGDRIHLVLTDVIMPGMNGRELVEKVAAYCPEAKVIYMSGYTGGRIGQNGTLDHNALFLTKPFRPGVLGQKVRQALDAE